MPTSNDFVSNESSSPHVDSLTIALASCHLFRSLVYECTTSLVNTLSCLVLYSQAKVDQFNLSIIFSI